MMSGSMKIVPENGGSAESERSAAIAICPTIVECGKQKYVMVSLTKSDGIVTVSVWPRWIDATPPTVFRVPVLLTIKSGSAARHPDPILKGWSESESVRVNV